MNDKREQNHIIYYVIMVHITYKYVYAYKDNVSSRSKFAEFYTPDRVLESIHVYVYLRRPS